MSDENNRDYKAEYRAYSAKHRQCISAEELVRLQLPENRLGSLAYGTGREIVCLDCGLKGKVLSSHLHKCPAGPTAAPKYKAKWGFARNQGLRSQDVKQRVSAALQAAVVAGNPSYRHVDVDALQRQGNAARRGKQGAKLRLQTIFERRKRPPRRKVSDPAIVRVMALDLPVTEVAKRAGLSVAAYYRRIQKLGWTSEPVRAERRLIGRYLFALRTWLRQQPSSPTIEQILERHAIGLQSGEAEAFRPFTRYIPHLESELKTQPALIGEIINCRDISAGGRLGSKVFQRAHAYQEGTPALPRKKEHKPSSEATLRKGEFCNGIIREMRQIQRLCHDSGWGIAEIQTAHPGLSVWNLREALSEEDRELFNHPRRWGPLVGYAFMLLGKHYGKAPSTVEDWVKAFRWLRRLQAAEPTTPQ